LAYSIQARISYGEPLPTLPQMYGSAPISRQKARNSSVPNWFVSISSPHQRFTVRGRALRGPMPSCQW